jgi:hypothetical protein
MAAQGKRPAVALYTIHGLPEDANQASLNQFGFALIHIWKDLSVFPDQIPEETQIEVVTSRYVQVHASSKRGDLVTIVISGLSFGFWTPAHREQFKGKIASVFRTKFSYRLSIVLNDCCDSLITSPAEAG